MNRFLTSLAMLALLATGLARDLSGVEFRNPDERVVTLAELTGHQPLTLLNFWATWCAPCRDELPLLLDVELGPDMALHAVNLGESPVRVSEYLANNHLLALPVLYLTARNSALLPIPGLPSSVLFDRDGKVLAVHYGAFTDETLASFLAEWSPKQ